MDRLEEIFALQRTLNEELIQSRHLEGFSPEEWLQKYAMALQVELSEMLEECNYKWWKNPKPVDKDKLQEEIVDVFHFFVSLCLASGMDAETLYRRYLDKNRENHLRQQGLSDKQGYQNPEI